MSKQPARGRYRIPDATVPQLRSIALVQLIAIAALALSTVVAATAVSIGHARADVARAAAGTCVAPYLMTVLPHDGIADGSRHVDQTGENSRAFRT
jgi:hypothetical protein